MDWIRRNWPDLIIGLALLAVIAGIIATLLSGGSFLPGSAPTAGTASPSTTPSVSTAQETPSIASETTDTVVAVDTEDVGANAVDVEVASAEDAETATQDAQADITPIIPSGEATDGVTETPATPVEASEEDASTAITSEAEASSAAPVSLEVGTASSELPYRISVGSYRDAANAERRAESFADAGYPTFIGTQDDLSIVLVGPYGTRTEAETAVAAIQRDGLEADPLLFEFSQETNEGSIVTVPAEAGATSGASASASSTTALSTTALSTTEGGSYLQAGAYNDSESAQPQRERLESLGLSVSEVQEGSFVKLLAGPFAGAELSAAQATLDEQGIDYFVRGN